MGEAELEALRELHRQADYGAAATLLLRAYGPELLGFLRARMRNEADGWEVFSILCEDLWRGLSGFEFRCTPRTWMYVLARNAEQRFRAAPHRPALRNLSLSDVVRDLAEQVRTTTEPYRRTDVRERFRELRERLPEEDELILLLRVDRGLSWDEIAHVLGGSEFGSSAPERQTRERARLRKRFQAIKERLRGWAIDEGLLDDQAGEALNPQMGSALPSDTD